MAPRRDPTTKSAGMVVVLAFLRRLDVLRESYWPMRRRSSTWSRRNVLFEACAAGHMMDSDLPMSRDADDPQGHQLPRAMVLRMGGVICFKVEASLDRIQHIRGHWQRKLNYGAKSHKITHLLPDFSLSALRYRFFFSRSV